MTLEKILSSIQEQKINCNITCDHYYKSETAKWTVRLSKMTDDYSSDCVTLSASHGDEDFDTAVRMAWKKFNRGVDVGIPELRPALEHIKE